MKIIARQRGKGKTTMLILKSAITGKRILVHNSTVANNLFYRAKELGVKIPNPISVYDLEKERIKGTSISRDGVLVDNIELVLQELLKIKIHMASISI